MPRSQITITFEDNGAVSVNGPLGDPILFHGLLSEAAATQRRWAAEQESRIVKPALNVPSDYKKL